MEWSLPCSLNRQQSERQPFLSLAIETLLSSRTLKERVTHARQDILLKNGEKNGLHVQYSRTLGTRNTKHAKRSLVFSTVSVQHAIRLVSQQSSGQLVGVSKI